MSTSLPTRRQSSPASPSRTHRSAWTLLTLALLAFAWAGTAAAVKRPFLPGPVETILRLGELLSTGIIGPHILASAWRVLAALVLAFVPATALGLAAGLHPRIDALAGPLLYVVHPLPKVVFLPLFFLFLGLGDEAKIALVAFIIFSQVAVSARDGARQIPPGLLEQMRVLGAGPWQLWRDVVIPASLPQLFSALRIALGTSVAVLFFAESFASESGLGWYIVDAWGRVAYTDMDAAIVALALLGVGLLALVDLAERLLCPWQPSR